MAQRFEYDPTTKTWKKKPEPVAQPASPTAGGITGAPAITGAPVGVSTFDTGTGQDRSITDIVAGDVAKDIHAGNYGLSKEDESLISGRAQDRLREAVDPYFDSVKLDAIARGAYFGDAKTGGDLKVFDAYRKGSQDIQTDLAIDAAQRASADKLNTRTMAANLGTTMQGQAQDLGAMMGQYGGQETFAAREARLARDREKEVLLGKIDGQDTLQRISTMSGITGYVPAGANGEQQYYLDPATGEYRPIGQETFAAREARLARELEAGKATGEIGGKATLEKMFGVADRTGYMPGQGGAVEYRIDPTTGRYMLDAQGNLMPLTTLAGRTWEAEYGTGGLKEREMQVREGELALRRDEQAFAQMAGISDITGLWGGMDSATMGAFGKSYGTSKGAPNYKAEYDLDSDGYIGVQDLIAFGAKNGSIPTMKAQQLAETARQFDAAQKQEREQMVGVVGGTTDASGKITGGTATLAARQVGVQEAAQALEARVQLGRLSMDAAAQIFNQTMAQGELTGLLNATDPALINEFKAAFGTRRPEPGQADTGYVAEYDTNSDGYIGMEDFVAYVGQNPNLGIPTLALRQMGEQARQFDRQADLAELNAAVARATQQGEATGVYVDPNTGQGIETLKSRLAQAEATGYYTPTNVEGAGTGGEGVPSITGQPAARATKPAAGAPVGSIATLAREGMEFQQGIQTKQLNLQADAQMFAQQAQMAGLTGYWGQVPEGKRAAFEAAYGSSKGEPNYDPAYDLDGDGYVGMQDFVVMVEKAGGVPTTEMRQLTEQARQFDSSRALEVGKITGEVEGKPTLDKLALDLQADAQRFGQRITESEVTGLLKQTFDPAEQQAFSQAFGKKQGEEGFSARYDINGNGEVDYNDFILFAKNAGAPVETLKSKSITADYTGNYDGKDTVAEKQRISQYGAEPPETPYEQQRIDLASDEAKARQAQLEYQMMVDTFMGVFTGLEALGIADNIGNALLKLFGDGGNKPPAVPVGGPGEPTDTEVELDPPTGKQPPVPFKPPAESPTGTVYAQENDNNYNVEFDYDRDGVISSRDFWRAVSEEKGKEFMDIVNPKFEEDSNFVNLDEDRNNRREPYNPAKDPTAADTISLVDGKTNKFDTPGAAEMRQTVKTQAAARFLTLALTGNLNPQSIGENFTRLWTSSMGQAGGTAVGALIGGSVGGPVGGMIGAAIGDMVGMALNNGYVPGGEKQKRITEDMQKAPMAADLDDVRWLKDEIKKAADSTGYPDQVLGNAQVKPLWEAVNSILEIREPIEAFDTFAQSNGWVNPLFHLMQSSDQAFQFMKVVSENKDKSSGEIMGVLTKAGLVPVDGLQTLLDPALGSKKGDANYNPDLDIDDNGKIDMADTKAFLAQVAKKHAPSGESASVAAGETPKPKAPGKSITDPASAGIDEATMEAIQEEAERRRAASASRTDYDEDMGWDETMGPEVQTENIASKPAAITGAGPDDFNGQLRIREWEMVNDVTGMLPQQVLGQAGAWISSPEGQAYFRKLVDTYGLNGAAARLYQKFNDMFRGVT